MTEPSVENGETRGEDTLPLDLPWKLDEEDVQHFSWGKQMDLLDAAGRIVCRVDCDEGDESRVRHILNAANALPDLTTAIELTLAYLTSHTTGTGALTGELAAALMKAKGETP